MNYFSTPKMQLIVFLSLIALTSVLQEKNLILFVFILIAVLTVFISDIIFIKVRKIQPFFLSAAIVSGLIIGLLLSPHLPWYQMIFAGVLASLGKNFIRLNGRHIFNPAALALFLVALIFHTSISWWGPAAAFLVFLLGPGYVSIIRLQRYWIVISFFIIYILITALLQISHVGFDMRPVLLNTLFNPATIFFSLVMLPEPMTTPNNHVRQILFGTFVALVAMGTGFIPFISIPDPLITGLLIGNLVFFEFR